MERTNDDLTYPGMRADLDLCYRQLFEICKGERGPLAVMSVPPRPSNFDMQFSAAFDELKAYRDTGLTPDEVIIQQGYVEGMKENLRIMYGDTSVQRLMELAKADKEGRCVVQEKTCDTCAYGDELKTEQPCCGCVDFCNWEAGEDG